MLRYDFKVGVKSRRSGAWTRDEDRRLLELVEEIGFKWTLIGEKIGRTGTQCSMRYRQSLDPRLQWRLWSADEVNYHHTQLHFLVSYPFILGCSISYSEGRSWLQLAYDLSNSE